MQAGCCHESSLGAVSLGQVNVGPRCCEHGLQYEGAAEGFENHVPEHTKNLQPRVQLLQASKELLKQQAAQAAAQGAAQGSKKRKAA